MNVKTICLAILHDGEATGYEIRKLSTEGEYAYFVDASYGSIYPALAGLESQGFVTSRVEQQAGRPAKKIYALTESGREELRERLFDDLGDDVFRSNFLLFARFAPELPADLVETRLRERLDLHDKKLESLRELRDERQTPGDAWVIEYGITCVQQARDYLAHHMNELIEMAQPVTRADAAE